MPDVKIKGYSAEFTYQDVPMVWLADPSQEIGEPVEGETPNLIPFTYGQAVAKTVAPDFSGGDMSVPIPEGELVNQLTITKPADLIPENIPEGMYIAGVGPGTFAGGGNSSGGLIVKSGTYTAMDAGANTIEHGLGVLPDLIMVYLGDSRVEDVSAMSDDCFLAIYAASSSMKDIGFPAYTFISTASGRTYDTKLSTSKNAIRSNTIGYPASNNNDTFTVGGVLFKHTVGVEYRWFAMAIQ